MDYEYSGLKRKNISDSNGDLVSVLEIRTWAWAIHSRLVCTGPGPQLGSGTTQLNFGNANPDSKRVPKSWGVGSIAYTWARFQGSGQVFQASFQFQTQGMQAGCAMSPGAGS